MVTRFISLELNEVNFDFVERYVRQGKLPVLGRLMACHGVRKTTSEEKYENLEPWIQWVTAHTGLGLADHGVYRLGDIVGRDISQIWEILESKGVSVAAMSPMNASNRCSRPLFFVPDPWTPEKVAGGTLLRRLHSALAQIVSDNAHGRIDVHSAFWLALAAIRYSRIRSCADIMHWFVRERAAPYVKAMVLDRLLADTFMKLWKQKRPGYSSLFLNAAAHIQHHYMYSSGVYAGPHKNPKWYLARERDPLLQVYSLYDRIVADVLEMDPDARIVVATGLHQDPCPDPVYYYRLRNHKEFLGRCGIHASEVLPLMSRDFGFSCESGAKLREAAERLRSLKAPDGTALFYAELRETSVFAMLTYPREISSPFWVDVGNGALVDMSAEVSFVAFKNGVHNGIGYLIDTGEPAGQGVDVIPLSSVFHRVLDHFGIVSPVRV